MARKDKILRSFLEHDTLKSKYEIKDKDLPKTVREAKDSEVPIIKTIALIVEKLESSNSTTDSALYTFITKYLNNATTLTLPNDN